MSRCSLTSIKINSIKISIIRVVIFICFVCVCSYEQMAHSPPAMCVRLWHQ